MAKISVALRNVSKPAPLWFRKLKKVSSLLSNAAIVILLSMGYADSSTIMLVLRVGQSVLMDSLETILADGEENLTNDETSGN
jgi:hypothetical protein